MEVMGEPLLFSPPSCVCEACWACEGVGARVVHDHTTCGTRSGGHTETRNAAAVLRRDVLARTLNVKTSCLDSPRHTPHNTREMERGEDGGAAGTRHSTAGARGTRRGRALGVIARFAPHTVWGCRE